MNIKLHIVMVVVATLSLGEGRSQTISADYLVVKPETRGWPEGGEIQLQGAGAYPNWQLDVYHDVFRIHTGGQARFELTSAGDLGIGTGFPQAKLDVAGDARLSGSLAASGWLSAGSGQLELGSAQAGCVPYIDFHYGTGTWTDYNVRLINDAPGVLTAVCDLKITGKATTRSLEITGGTDIAEMFTSPQALEPGTVVVADVEHEGQVRTASAAYDDAVIGIVSGAGDIKPAQILRLPGTLADGEIPVSMGGRVWCKCDASNGDIKPGTLLTTSATPGHAMKASDKARAQGAIVGKALTSLKEGKGLVLVWVTHQ